MSTVKLKSIRNSIMLVVLSLITSFSEASFQLETMTVIVDANEPRKLFNVKNVGKEPILLSTKVSNLEGGKDLANNVMVSPPIVRIEPQESQQINFVLKKDYDLSDEELLKVSFQGVGTSKANTTKMPIRQDVAMLIMPKGMSISLTPWDYLKITQQDNMLTLKNTGKQVIRLSPNFTSKPDGNIYNLGQFYLRPGEVKKLKTQNVINQISISPLSRYGFKMQKNIDVDVKNISEP